MTFDQIIGHEHIKQHLQKSADNGRIPHAQLFIGKEGTGTLLMAITYAKYILCLTSNDPDSCEIKCDKLQHPDLHFAFPVTTNDKVKKHPVSDLFIEYWRSFIAEKPYGNLFDWLHHIGVDKKQGIIGVDEAENIVKKLQLKSYEGGFKVMIIWMAEKMNQSASNKLLKLIEEPPEKTVFLLVSEDEGQIIKTITSRCQIINFPILSELDIENALIDRQGITQDHARNIANQSEGSYNKAIHISKKDTTQVVFEQWFITWVRSAFKARGNASVIKELIEWSNSIAAEGREVQKQFLQYCMQFFRQAMLLNYGSENLVFFRPKTEGFKLENFAPFIHSGNILEIEKELSKAQYQIERNGNAKIILLDLSMCLTRLLHTKEQ